MNLDHLNIDRRRFLKTATAIGAASVLTTACSEQPNPDAPAMPKGALDKDGNIVPPWSNWSGNQSSSPTARLLPQESAELSQMIKDTKQRIRLVGAGHSFSGLVATDESLMSLAYFSGISDIDTQNKQIELGANTFLATVGSQLWDKGLSLENMPDINTQTFGGAIATSTHGTGIKFGSMSSTVTEMTLVNGLGEELTCSANTNSELFNAARCNIGTLGAITRLKIQATDKYHLREKSWMMNLEEGLERMEALRDTHRNFEAYALPHADYILGIAIDDIPESELQTQKTVNGDAYETFRMLSNVIDYAPFLRRFIVNKGASSVEEEVRTGRNYEIFGNLRDIQFNEMEYSVPAEVGVACLREILTTIKKKDIPVIFPIEYRYVKNDDIWLSQFYQQDSCAISIHNFHDKDYKKYFAEIEPIFWKYNGRPHWGKIHTLNAKKQRALLPKFNDFLEIRQAMDPNNIFTNPHINHVLGLS